MLGLKVQEEILHIIHEVNPDIFIVELSLKKANNSKLLLLMDTDEGLHLTDCTRVSRKIGVHLEDHPEFDFPFTLEVSSPGIGNGLTILRQYKKNIGRTLMLTLNSEENLEGILTAVNDQLISIEFEEITREKKKKIKKTIKREILFEDIKMAKVKVLFS